MVNGAPGTNSYPDLSIQNTLEVEPRDRVESRASYRYSGKSDSSIPEALMYKLVAQSHVIDIGLSQKSIGIEYFIKNCCYLMRETSYGIQIKRKRRCTWKCWNPKSLHQKRSGTQGLDALKPRNIIPISFS